MASESAKVTVTSLAKELGLSTCTVSKILNRSFDGFTYAAETIRKVETAARRRGYVPNAHARSLRTKKSMTIGLVVPSGIPYFSGTLVERIERELRPLGYETIVGHSTPDAGLESKLIKTMLGKGIDGLLWIPHGKSLTPKALGISENFPLVLLDRPGFSGRFPTVITDNEGASRDLAGRIKDAGHTSVLMLTASDDDDSILERENGIRSVFKTRAVRIDAGNDIDSARIKVARLGRKKLEGSVLVCLTQNLALGALIALMDHGLFVGVDLGFASFDDLPLCNIWQPSLTRIEQNIDLLANMSVKLLLSKAADASAQQPLEVRIPAILHWGRSITERSSARQPRGAVSPPELAESV